MKTLSKLIVNLPPPHSRRLSFILRRACCGLARSHNFSARANRYLLSLLLSSACLMSANAASVRPSSAAPGKLVEEDFTRIFDQIKESEYEIRWQQEAAEQWA